MPGNNAPAGKPLYVTQEAFSEINPDDPFFDSFKHQYINFTGWFSFMAQSGEKAWIYSENDAIFAFLYIEEQIGSLPKAVENLSAEKYLNISRCKITVHIPVITELFLKIVISQAVKKSMDLVCFHCFPDTQQSILPLLKELGFKKTARKSNQEDIYLKHLKPPSQDPDHREIREKYYPAFYDGIKVRKFILPLVPALHKRLFPDLKEYQPTLFESAGEIFIEGNTIKKIIRLPDKKNPDWEQGDILLCCSTADNHAITSLCIVEAVYRQQGNRQKTAEILLKHPGYQLEEPEFSARGDLLLFRWHFHLPEYPDSGYLLEHKIVKSSSHKITRIDQRKYRCLIEKSKLDNSYILH